MGLSQSLTIAQRLSPAPVSPHLPVSGAEFGQVAGSAFSLNKAAVNEYSIGVLSVAGQADLPRLQSAPRRGLRRRVIQPGVSS